MSKTSMLTVVETPSFIGDAKKLLDDDEREALINYLDKTVRKGYGRKTNN